AAVIARLSPLELRADLTMESGGKSAGIVSKLVVDGKVGQARLHLATQAIGNPLDRDALDLDLDGNLAADDGAQLLAVLGLSRFVNLEKGPGSARVMLRGRPAGDLDVCAQLAASGPSAHASGRARPRCPA